VHVDLAAITFFSARGVAALLAARAVATRAGGSLVVTSASRPAHRVLEITGVLDELRPAPPAQGLDLTNPQESVADG
jgi:anti-anti-sigma factor